MRVLILIVEKKKQVRLLVKLETQSLINEVKSHLSRGQTQRAMMAAIARGRFEKALAPGEQHTTEADLILTPQSAHWDIA